MQAGQAVGRGTEDMSGGEPGRAGRVVLGAQDPDGAAGSDQLARAGAEDLRRQA